MGYVVQIQTPIENLIGFSFRFDFMYKLECNSMYMPGKN